MRYFLTILLSYFLLSSVAYASGLDEHQRKNLAIIQNYLVGIKQAKGQFTQVGPDGILSSGEFYLRRPGKMRFEYYPPTPVLLISDGFWVAVEDTELKTQDRYPLSSTPLHILLSDAVDLEDAGYVQDIRVVGDNLVLKAGNQEDAGQGEVELIFSQKPIALTKWIVTDAQGLKTIVTLKTMTPMKNLDNRLFYIENDAQANQRF